jgi:hypothetical protein
MIWYLAPDMQHTVAGVALRPSRLSAKAQTRKRDSTMKRYPALALAAFILVLAAPSAFALRMRVVDAPTGPISPTSADSDCTSNGVNTPCAITDVSDIYAINFVDSSNPGCQSAAGISGVGTAGIAGFNFCMILANETNPQTPLTGFSFTFVVPMEDPSSDVYSSVFCDGVPGNVLASSCPQGPLHEGDVITASFSAQPGVPVGQLAYLFVDFTNNPGTSSVTASLSVPEPGVLGLFGLGLLAVGAGLQLAKAPRHP